MPNHVTTRCTVTGPKDDVAAFTAKAFQNVPFPKSDDTKLAFDFNEVIPMPLILREAEESTQSELGASLLLILADQGALTHLGDLHEFQVEAARGLFAAERTPIDAVAKAYLAQFPEVAEAGKAHLQAIAAAAQNGDLLTAEKVTLPWGVHRMVPPPEALMGATGAAWVVLAGTAGAPFARGGLYEAHVQRMREDLELPDAPMTTLARVYLHRHPEVLTAGLHRLTAIAETGYSSWYPWAIEHWATKWGAYDLNLEENEEGEEPLEFTFNTAWSFPTPIFEALAKMFPTLTFGCDTYDEGGNFAGEGYFNPGADQDAFTIVPADDTIYERVYGHEPEHDEEEEEDDLDEDDTPSSSRPSP